MAASEEIKARLGNLQAVRRWIDSVRSEKLQELAALLPASPDLKGTKAAIAWLASACTVLDNAGMHLQGLADGTYGKRRLCDLSPEQVEEVKEAVARPPAESGFEGKRWTGGMVIALVQRRFGVQLNRTLVSDRRAMFGLLSPADRAVLEYQRANAALDDFLL